MFKPSFEPQFSPHLFTYSFIFYGEIYFQLFFKYLCLPDLVKWCLPYTPNMSYMPESMCLMWKRSFRVFADVWGTTEKENKVRLSDQKVLFQFHLPAAYFFPFWYINENQYWKYIGCFLWIRNFLLSRWSLDELHWCSSFDDSIQSLTDPLVH